MLLLGLLLTALLLDGGQVLGIALCHELLDIAGKAVHQGLDLRLLGLHVGELVALLLLEGLEVGLLLLEVGLLLLELRADLLDLLDDLLVGIVDFFDIAAVGEELVKGLGGEQQLERAARALLVAVGNARGKHLLLVLEFLLLLLDLLLRLVDLPLDIIDLGDGLFLLEREGLELGGELLELRFHGGELFLGGGEGVERLLRRLCGERAVGHAEQDGGAGERERGLDGAAAGEVGVISQVEKGVLDALLLLGFRGGRVRNV